MHVQHRHLLVLAGLWCFGVLISPGSAEGASISSTFVEQPVSIDGDIAEWDNIPFIYLDKSVRILAVANDADALYVSWRFADERLARALCQRGLTVWLDEQGQRQKRFGIRYACSEEIARHLDAKRERGGEPPRHDERRGPGPGAEALPHGVMPGKVQLLDEDEVTTRDGETSGQLAAASTIADEQFCYELRVSRSLIAGRLAEDAPTGLQKLSLGLEIGGLTTAERQEHRKHRGSSGGGFGMSMGGGGMRLGMGGGGRGGMGGDDRGGMGGREGGPPDGREMGETPRPPEYARETVWLTVKLAPGPSSDCGASH